MFFRVSIIVSRGAPSLALVRIIAVGADLTGTGAAFISLQVSDLCHKGLKDPSTSWQRKVALVKGLT